ncbi:glycosidase, partial [Salmonella enterica]
IEEEYEAFISRGNEIDKLYDNGIYDRWKHPVLSCTHVPPFWVYDPNPETNPYMMKRLGINAVFNSGAILLDGKFTLVAR